MMAAVTAAREKAAVTVYEHRSEAGRKLLMTGNGKCNLTNMRMGLSYYYCDSARGQQMIRSVLAGFDEKRTLAFFHEIGMLTCDRDGYVYPLSEQAVTVRDVLVRECLICGVTFRYDTDVYPILSRDEETGQFVIGTERFDRLIFACGGKSERQTGSDGSGYELAKRFGHRISTPLPALVPLYTSEENWKSMAGVRAKGRLRLLDEGRTAGESCGELQITAQGISGIPVFELSRIAVHAIHEGKRVEAEICFLNGRQQKQIEALLRCMLERGAAGYDNQNDARGNANDSITHSLKRVQENGEQLADTIQSSLTGIVNTKILSFILDKIVRETNILHNGLWYHNQLAAAVAHQLFSMRILIDGHGKLEHAQVTSGGILFDEVTEHLESRFCKGLFFAGEMLDVDGICGGYNLQWAWSSGYTAGICAAKE